MKIRTNFAPFLLLFLVVCLPALAQDNSKYTIENQDKFISKVMASLPKDNALRLALEQGERGDGVHYFWMDKMKALGVKQASYVFNFDLRKNRLTGVTLSKVAYHPKYYFYDFSIKNSAVLERIRLSGLETELQKEASKRAQEYLDRNVKGRNVAPSGTLYINLLDDERLPILADMADIIYLDG